MFILYSKVAFNLTHAHTHTYIGRIMGTLQYSDLQQDSCVKVEIKAICSTLVSHCLVRPHITHS